MDEEGYEGGEGEEGEEGEEGGEVGVWDQYMERESPIMCVVT